MAWTRLADASENSEVQRGASAAGVNLRALIRISYRAGGAEGEIRRLAFRRLTFRSRKGRTNQRTVNGPFITVALHGLLPGFVDRVR